MLGPRRRGPKPLADPQYPDESKYDDVMKEFREGLFPYLQPETLKKVAYQNAVKVFKLTE